MVRCSVHLMCQLKGNSELADAWVVRLAWSSIVAVDVEEGYMRICGNVASEDKIVFTLLDRSDGMEFTWRLGQSTQMERRGGWGWGGGGC